MVTRGGFTIVELLVALVAGTVLLSAILSLQRGGLVRIHSDQRAVDATGTAHHAVEVLRRDAMLARWTWVVPLADIDSGRPPDIESIAPDWMLAGTASATSDTPGRMAPTGTPGLAPASKGSPLVYLGDLCGVEGITECFGDPAERRLYEGARSVAERIDSVLFFTAGPHVLKFAIQSDEHSASTGLNAARERATLVSSVWLQAQQEESENAAITFERSHNWCIGGEPIHSGFLDP